MKNLILCAFFVFVLISPKCFSQESTTDLKFTKNLEIDSKIAFEESNEIQTVEYSPIEGNKKSPVVAGLLSLVLPGAGQVYTGNYLKAGIFVAIEGALITTAIIYNNKGDKQTDDFQNYADKNWSVVQYAEWLNAYHKNILQDNVTIEINSNASLPPWERVNWQELNNAEIGSHRLPEHGQQQYYEEIGKYHEYSPGWDDYTNGNDYYQVSANFLSYSDMRGKANSLYTTSNTAVIGLYINHALSIIDAIWDVSRYNNQLAVKFRLDPQYFYAYSPHLVPTIKLSYSF